MRVKRAFVLAVVLCGMGGSAAAERAGAGGATGTEPVPAAGQESAQHRWRPLRSAEATATSYLQNDWNLYQENYHPSYVLDENPATAWVEGAKGFGENEAITLPLSALRSARALRLRIWNGYQKSMHLWTKNAMPRRVRVTVLDADEEEVTASETELTRTRGPQEVVVDLPRGRGLAAVRITILSVYPGLRFDDTCISDILVDVDSDVPYNPVAENAKHEALLKWVAGRKDQARYFASRPPEFPFAFSRFVSKKASGDRQAFKQRFAAREAIGKTLGPTRYKPVTKQSVKVLPDGLSEENNYAEDFAQLFKADRVALLETKDDVVSRSDDEDGNPRAWTSSARVARGPDQKAIQALAFEAKEVITERSTWSYDRNLLLVYDGDGRLQTLYRSVNNFSESEGEDDYDTVTDTDEIWSFVYDAAGKVREIDVDSLARHHRMYGKKAAREREDRRAKHVVYLGLPDKSS
ncbi:MAG TPA: hypothetical protein VKZ18_22710 [Polyangia bacterium]|nr:hypothetical protein [Polyangia bacterium]